MDVRTAPAAQANICNLHDDLMMHILSRLPSKPLAICKCVCKSWCRLVSTLIHSPTRPITGFVLDFFDHWRPSTACLRTMDEFIAKDTLGFLPCHPHTKILDCDDGFLLCCRHMSMGNPDPVLDECYVCNPVTRQWVSLPKSPERSVRDEHVTLVMDKSSDSDVYYHHYKVFRFVSVYEFGTFVDVYSSHAGKWTKSKAYSKADMQIVGPSLFLDGLLFILACNSRFIYVLMYDVKEEYCKELDLPIEFGDFGDNVFSESYCLGVSEGCLSFAYHKGPRINVWMMESNNIGEWVLKHAINFVDIGIPAPLPNPHDLQQEVLALHPNLDAIFVRKDDCIFCYDFNSKALEKIMHLQPLISDSFLFGWVYPFSECLCPMADAQRRTEKRKW